ncbi:TetR/AcrR family transcriptional regulator [Kitasatospora sp. MAP5-34]|uniref:TetR/AcrR family transcriptional regulator n=1 Tax=Kitasatospora sp. MAP5-34 TaxID=3035102 RepID=UPI002476C7AD|nr:TetR/AcrR family transcriptional regulator [Kitasatospora sp. MAP5-34]MDH6578382.1 AcrR family transcriptional regulator [Kitasatospora sp. MAP5-34]
MRMSAEERRESVIRAAVTEFARGGYHGTSTEAIARRVGVSQPYLFRLFPSKQAIFIEACRRCTEEVWQVFDRASEGLSGEDARRAMGLAYMELVQDRDRILMQMQMQVAAANTDTAGDPEVGEAVRRAWFELWERVRIRMGGDHGQATEFFGYGMLINSLVAMGFPLDHRVWAGFGDEQTEGRTSGKTEEKTAQKTEQSTEPGPK